VDNTTGIVLATSLGAYTPSSNVTRGANEFYSFF